MLHQKLEARFSCHFSGLVHCLWQSLLNGSWINFYKSSYGGIVHGCVSRYLIKVSWAPLWFWQETDMYCVNMICVHKSVTFTSFFYTVDINFQLRLPLGEDFQEQSLRSPSLEQKDIFTVIFLCWCLPLMVMSLLQEILDVPLKPLWCNYSGCVWD